MICVSVSMFSAAAFYGAGTATCTQRAEKVGIIHPDSINITFVLDIFTLCSESQDFGKSSYLIFFFTA